MEVGSVILAGGKASRMGGADKALLPLAGKPLVSHAIARLAPQVSTMIISANGELSRFAPFGLPVIADSLAEYPGPLAGLLAGLEWTPSTGPTSAMSPACRSTHPSFHQISSPGSWLSRCNRGGRSWPGRRAACIR